MQRILVGVMGPGEAAKPEDTEHAFQLGRAIAQQGWILLTGGRDCGVMDAAARGAKSAGGLTIGILPGDTDAGLSPAIDIPIITGMGQARNNINVLSCAAIFACGIGAGTASEIALALKANRRVILLGGSPESAALFTLLVPENTVVVNTVDEAVGAALNTIGAAE